MGHYSCGILVAVLSRFSGIDPECRGMSAGGALQQSRDQGGVCDVGEDGPA